MFRGLSRKLIIIMFLFSIALSSAIGYIGYETYMATVVKRYEEFASSILKVARSHIDTDDMLYCLNSGEKTLQYHYTQIAFNMLVEETDITFLYYFYPQDDRMIYYINAYTEAELNQLREGQFLVSLLNTDPLPNNLNIDEMGYDIQFITDVSRYGHMMGAYMAVRDTNEDIIGILVVDIDMYDINSTRQTYLFTVIIGAAMIMFVFTAIAILYFRSKITRPIQKLSESTDNFVNKNSEEELQPIVSTIKTNDEIETLSVSIEQMTIDMITYIKNLTAVTAEKERIGAELTVATQIQASMLPTNFPVREELELFASMCPAKEVGGDFYDFFFIDKNTLAIVMADVSGKGVPAALFMVIAKTLIKNSALRGLSPGEVFETANNMLCEGNDAGMFVTAFMGYLDIPTGKFTFVNAGHNPPILKRDGKFDWLNGKVGFVLAGMEEMPYVENEITIQPGEELYLYTDGVTEAQNMEEELFTDPYLLVVANECQYNTIEEFSVYVKEKIDEFAGEAPQADDITMLMLKYKG
ncbi:MAG: SpoIIE family protein phosphatase [Oscillospiraceae bacterium]|nr:SpoIIE family protein phosphatase [Oscillospiraceae bacterium]